MLPSKSVLCGFRLSPVARDAGFALGDDHEKGSAMASSQGGAAVQTLRLRQSFALLGTLCSCWGKPVGLRVGP